MVSEYRKWYRHRAQDIRAEQKNSSSPGYPQLLYIDGEPIAGGKTRLVALLNLWWSKRAVTRTFQLAVITATVLINMVATAFADPVALSITSYHRPQDLLTTVKRIRFDVPVLAPVAFVRFCLKYPRDCEIRRMPFRPRPISLTRERVSELIKVNRAINVAIAPEEDHGRVDQEQWLVSPHAGDCNDYAVSKRHELLARGWPSRSLLLAEMVVTAIGKHHLVLVVRAREGDFILDNLYQDIRPVSQAPYKWVRAQQEKNPRFWSTVSPARTEEIVMNVR